VNMVNETFINRHQIAGEAICSALQAEALKLGFNELDLPQISWSELVFSIKPDTVDGVDCLTGDWKDPSGYRVGQIQFNGDGSFFAEHDIVLAHPGDKRWFVEAVEAWGRLNQINSEPRLLAAV